MPDLIGLFIANNPDPSDYFLVVAFLAAAWFAISYLVGSPWWKIHDHGLVGVMTLLHSWSVASLLFLIVYAIVFGQRVDESVRLPIAFLLALATITKVAILHHERRTGRIARRDAKRAAREKELS